MSRPGAQATRRVRRRRLSAGVGLAGALLCAAALARGADPDAVSPLRLGFTEGMFTEVNENDARASIKALAIGVAKERGLEVSPDAQVFPDLATLVAAVQAQTIDAACITVTDYFTSAPTVRWGALFAPTNGVEAFDTYCLLVRRDSGVQQVADLRGRRLTLMRNARTCLAEAWLDGLLRSAGLPATADAFAAVTRPTKLSPTVLPVFFQQSDACLVTKRGFDTMVELNPQVGLELHVLATSPRVMPVIMCFRGDYAAPAKDRLLAGLRDMHQTAAGRQVLAIFKSDQLVEIAPAQLESTRQVFAGGRAGARLRAAAGSQLPAPPPLQPGGGS